MRRPTSRPRQLLMLPPLLRPTRGWNVIGHSRSDRSLSSAVSRKWALNSRLTAGSSCGKQRHQGIAAAQFVGGTDVGDRAPPRCLASSSLPTKILP